MTSRKPKRLHKQARARRPRKDQIERMETHRRFLKSDRWEEWRKLETDQKKGVPPPQPQKPFPEDAKLISLISPEKLTVNGRLPTTGEASAFTTDGICHHAE